MYTDQTCAACHFTGEVIKHHRWPTEVEAAELFQPIGASFYTGDIHNELSGQAVSVEFTHTLLVCPKCGTVKVNQ